MNGILNLTTKIVAFADQQASSQPRLKFVDWLRDQPGLAITDPKSEGHRLAVGESLEIFSGVRATSIAADTEFDVELSPLDSSRYRFTWTGGTDPVLRTGRSLASSGKEITITVNANATATMESNVALFGSVVAGDIVFIPHTTTGDDANEFNVLNAGYWQVLSKASTTEITLVRLAGEDFVAYGETVTLTDNDQLRAYTTAGVQVGDDVEISAGFAEAAWQTYEVVAVTDAFFEVISTTALPDEAGVAPDEDGMIFYSSLKNFIYLETNQQIAVQLNGDVGLSQKVTPYEPNEPSQVGVYYKRGPAFSMTIVNLSTSVADVTVIYGG